MFKKKNILITGATGGLGSEIVRQLKETEYNCLYLVGRNFRVFSDTPKEKSFIVDFTDPYSVQKFLDEIQSYSIHVLINCAGINRFNDITELDMKNYNDILMVNLTVPIRIINCVSKLMIQREIEGRIVNIASISGVISMPKRTPYSASKAGLIGATKAIALDLAQYNILANAVSPGVISNEMTWEVIKKYNLDIDSFKRKIPLGRLATNTEVAKLVLWLASEENTYCTGANFICDGGYTIV